MFYGGKRRMDEMNQIFKGILLAAIGLIVIYESVIYSLLDIILLLGLLMLFIGIIMLISIFLPKGSNQNELITKTKHSLSNKKNNLTSETRSIASLDDSYNNESIFTTINKQFAERFTNPEYNSKAVLRSNPQVWDEPSYNYEELEEDSNSRNISLSPSKQNKSRKNNLNKIGMIPKGYKKHPPVRQFNFTPNYEKPMKVTRKPKRREVPLDYENVEAPVYQEPIPESITPVYAEEYGTVYDEEETISKPSIVSNVNNHKINDDTYNLIPKNTKSTELSDFITEKTHNVQNVQKTNPSKVKKGSRLRKSYVICNQGIMTSENAFELIGKHAKSEIFLEVPSLKELSSGFLANICKLNTKLIIQEFNLKDTSYILLISALIEDGVKVKLLPIVNTFNLISDDSYALIISNGEDQIDFDYGAVYTDIQSINLVKDNFNKSWDLAHNLDNK